jgi:Flp pilus assembly protein protease CpaA
MIGAVTCVTDSLYRKIINSHLFSALILILSAYVGVMVADEIPGRMSLFLLNAVAGFTIGYVLFFTESWGGGDGKLFFVYSLLVPENPAYAQMLPLPAFVLFVDTFIAAFLILMVFAACSWVGSFHGKKSIGPVRFFPETKRFAGLFLVTLVYALALNWLFVLLMNVAARFSIPPLAMLVIFYLTFMFLNKVLGWVWQKSHVVFWTLLAASLAVQGILNPAFYFNRFTPWFLFYFVTYILLQRGVNSSIKNKKNPFMPFALFMFIGALLSQTDFLSMVWLLLGHH